MPELPEVETIRRQLEPEVVGRRIDALEILDPRWTEPVPPATVERAVAGRRIEVLDRRGKWLLMGLERGVWLVMHLRMTGNLVLTDADEDRFLRARIALDDGRRLLFNDARRFGTGQVVSGADLEDYLRPRAGIEPLSDSFTPDAIGELAAGRTAPLKSFLMMQSGIAGIGNIYADEALHRARLHPLSPAGSMRRGHWEDLHEGIVETLEAGLANGGASIDDYRDSRGEPGSMQDEFLVHSREGLPCPRCGEPIRRIVVGGRSTYFCPGCQKRLRRRRRPVHRRAATARP
jgi:formamidopyrimidine-DNA glycosylase